MSKISSKEVNEFVEKNLGPEFFLRNVPSQMSAYNIIELTLVDDSIEEKMYKSLPKERINEMLAENKMVEAEEDANKLYNFLRRPFSPTAVKIIIGKLLKDESQVIPKLIEDLKRSGNDNFVESAAKLLLNCQNNYSKELAEILPQTKYPYTQSVIGYVLGKVGEEEHIEALYNSFNFFKTHYKSEAFHEGPLIGLYEMKRRFEF